MNFKSKARHACGKNATKKEALFRNWQLTDKMSHTGYEQRNHQCVGNPSNADTLLSHSLNVAPTQKVKHPACLLKKAFMSCSRTQQRCGGGE